MQTTRHLLKKGLNVFISKFQEKTECTQEGFSITSDILSLNSIPKQLRTEMMSLWVLAQLLQDREASRRTPTRENF